MGRNSSEESLETSRLCLATHVLIVSYQNWSEFFNQAHSSFSEWRKGTSSPSPTPRQLQQNRFVLSFQGFTNQHLIDDK